MMREGLIPHDAAFQVFHSDEIAQSYEGRRPELAARPVPKAAARFQGVAAGANAQANPRSRDGNQEVSPELARRLLKQRDNEQVQCHFIFSESCK